MSTYVLDSLEYANAYERMYGVSDEVYRSLVAHQERLARFETEPSFEMIDRALLERVLHQKDHLQHQGNARLFEGPVFDKVEVDFVHSTASYEGNTLSVEQVSLVLNEDAVIPEKPLHEHLEVLDIRNAFAEAAAMARRGDELTVEGVLRLHRLASANLEECDPAGEFRCDMRYVTGSPILPPPPGRVPDLVERLVGWYNAQPSLERAAGFHLVFEDIHPFADGNGRTGRVIANFMLMRLGFPPIAFKGTEEAKRAYYDEIAQFTRSIERREAGGMVNVMARALEESLRLVIADGESRRTCI